LDNSDEESRKRAHGREGKDNLACPLHQPRRFLEKIHPGFLDRQLVSVRYPGAMSASSGKTSVSRETDSRITSIAAASGCRCQMPTLRTERLASNVAPTRGRPAAPA